jgi:23S rRNA U2552 (ribose-2'-O)-methylase RlmE/FtsJ
MKAIRLRHPCLSSNIAHKSCVDMHAPTLSTCKQIHQFMTGRIKLLKNGVPVSATNNPPLGYDYDAISPFDARCGTFNLESSKLPNSQCPNRFVCVPDSAETKLKEFSACIDAMNCHMMRGMTTGTTSDSRAAIFLQQMIPHHQNAVNMAKALLHETGQVVCPDITNEEAPDCILEVVLRDIVNVQNAQIQTMRAILDDKKLPEVDDCPVTVDSVRENQCPNDDSCRMWFLFSGSWVHRQFLGVCIRRCTALPLGFYLNSGWECGGCD